MAHHLVTFKKWLSQHPLEKVREGTRSCLWCSTLNVNFKNVDPPYPVISSAIQLNLGGQSTEGQQKVYTCTIARCQNRAPTRYTAFSQPHPFPHHMWAFRIDGKKCNPFPPHSLPYFLRQPESKRIWSRVMAEPAAYCNFQCFVSPREELKS